jgi:hypothetical protein
VTADGHDNLTREAFAALDATKPPSH